MKTCVFLLISIFSFQAISKPKKVSFISGLVKSCHDGDTSTVLSLGKKISVRLSGIDAPELKQRFGKDARDYTESIVRGKVVNLECDGKSFRRVTCLMYFGPINVNQEITKAGWAFDSPKYSKGAFSSYESEARNSKKGIWKDSAPVSPHCFRHPNYSQCKFNKSFMP